MKGESMGGDRLELRVALTAADLDADGLAECAAGLGGELGELDVDEVVPAAEGQAPAGAKGVELLAVGALVVKLVRSGKVLGQVVDAVREWLNRNDADSVRLEIGGDVLEISNATAEERRALIDAWVQRHGGE